MFGGLDILIYICNTKLKDMTMKDMTMTLIEKIETGLTLSTTDDEGNLFLFVEAFNDLFENDVEIETIRENVYKVHNIFNNSENKEKIMDMEVSDVLKM